jgi:lipopolysaccharide export system ATP-binding protein
MILCGRNLKKFYNRREVVHNVSLEVSSGEIVGLLGSNGAGKTTVFYMMVGLAKGDGGKIVLEDEDISHLSLASRSILGIGYLPQEASIFRDLDVESNIYAALESRKGDRELLEGLLNDFGLVKIRKSLGKSLSGGERRRVEIARLLSLNPKFIFFDEPFAGVDPMAVKDVQNIIVGLKKRNIGILITDHNVRETLNIVDRAYIMNEGSIIASGSAESIIKNPLAKNFYLGEDFRI